MAGWRTQWTTGAAGIACLLASCTEDADVSTWIEQPAATLCQSAAECDDHEPCTLDECVEHVGCVNIFRPSCDDGSGPGIDAALDLAIDWAPFDVGVADAVSGDLAGDAEADADPCGGAPVQHWCRDADGDQHGDPNNTLDACEEPPAYVLACDDCDDWTAGVNPDAPELCNFFDDDCDWDVDEDLGVGGDCFAGLGVCEAWGVLECLPTGEVGCGAVPLEPSVETCNRLDDDCNGTVDDMGDAEACNGLDDDCDGDIDEGLGLGNPCIVGVGVCRAEGVNGCTVDGQVACEAVPLSPSTETCDGVDNDCDGTVDNTPDGCVCDDGLEIPCGSDVGACTPGVQTCVGGRFGPCEGATESAPEICDGADNNCDGAIDNLAEATRLCGTDTGECAPGTETCVGGSWGACEGGIGPVDEIYDHADNDCDGEIDNVVCAAAATDFPAGESYQGCLSQDGVFHAFEPANTDAATCAQAFDQMGGLLWRADHPAAQAFTDARQIYGATLEGRVRQRFDAHFQSDVPAGTDCGAAGVPALHPDYCVGPATLIPVLTAAFDAGVAGQNPDANAARIEAALLWFLSTSVHGESVTCATALADCDAAHAYYTAATSRDDPAGLAAYVAASGDSAHARVFDATLAAHCWRELDPGASAANLELQALALAQLDVALDHAAALILFARLHTWENAVGDARDAAWAFIGLWGQALDRALRVRDRAQADAVGDLLGGDGTGVTAAPSRRWSCRSSPARRRLASAKRTLGRGVAAGTPEIAAVRQRQDELQGPAPGPQAPTSSPTSRDTARPSRSLTQDSTPVSTAPTSAKGGPPGASSSGQSVSGKAAQATSPTATGSACRRSATSAS